jgi:hypothetical protein
MGVGVEGAIGFLMSNDEVTGYGVFGATIGGEIGGEVDIAAVYRTDPAKDTGGGYVGVIVALEVGIGGIIQILFAVDPVKFAGFSIGIGTGAEAGYAIDGGYTWIFD